MARNNKENPEQENEQPGIKSRKRRAVKKISEQEQQRYLQTRLEADAVFNMCASIWGADKFVLRASKFGALDLIQSGEVPERVLALQRMVKQDLAIDKVPTIEEIPEIIEELLNEMAEHIAVHKMEENIDKKISKNE